MSHELDNANGRTTFVYNAQNGDPWHHLGTAIDGTADLDTMLHEAQADYTVTLAPVYAQVITPDGVTTVEAPDHRASYRPHPETGEAQLLGVVGKDWTPVQNRDAAMLALDIVGASKGDAVFETMGVMRDGREFFAAINVGSLFIDPRGINDEVKNYVGVRTGHDGTRALTVFNDDIRPVCNNTVTAAVASAKKHGAKRYFSMRHTTNIQTRARVAGQALAVAQAWSAAFEETANRLLEVRGGHDVLDRVVEHVFAQPGEDATKRAQTMASDRRAELHRVYDLDTNAGKFGHNGWTVFNAVGEYLDHYRRASANQRAYASGTPGSWVDAAKVKARELLLASN